MLKFPNVRCNIMQVTKNVDGSGNWRSAGDLFTNGAYFQQSGAAATSPLYQKSDSFSAISASQVSAATAGAGPTG